jgi:hypothetical protein
VCVGRSQLFGGGSVFPWMVQGTDRDGEREEDEEEREKGRRVETDGRMKKGGREVGRQREGVMVM